MVDGGVCFAAPFTGSRAIWMLGEAETHAGFVASPCILVKEAFGRLHNPIVLWPPRPRGGCVLV